MSPSKCPKALTGFSLAFAMAACLNAGALFAAEVWRKTFTAPFTKDSGANEITSLAEFNGEVYLATGGLGRSGKVWRQDSQGCKQWKDATPSWSAQKADFAMCMATFQGYLYAGTGGDGRVWRTSDGQKWADATANMPAIGRITAMAEFKGQLYIANFTTIWRTSNGTSWQPVVGLPPAATPAGFGDPKSNDICALTVFNGYLYAGVGRDNSNGIQIWRTDDGVNWKLFHEILPGNMLGFFPGHVHAMKPFGNYLYIGEYHGTAVSRTDGSLPPSPAHWQWVAYLGPKNGPLGDVFRMAEHKGKLYVGMSFRFTPDRSGPMLYATTDGTNWSEVAGAPQAEADSIGVMSLLSQGDKLYVGTGNSSDSGSVVLWELDTEILPDKFDATPTKNNTPKTATPLAVPFTTGLPPSIEHLDLNFHDPKDLDYFQVSFSGKPETLTILARDEYCGPLDVKLYEGESKALPATAKGKIQVVGNEVRITDPSSVVPNRKLLVRLANPNPKTPIRYQLRVTAAYSQLKNFQKPEAYRDPPYFDFPAKTKPSGGVTDPMIKGGQATLPKVPGPVNPSLANGAGVKKVPSPLPDPSTMAESTPPGATIPPPPADQGQQPTGVCGLHGRVFALDQKGEKITDIVSGATIQFTDQAGGPVATATSSRIGYYRANLTPGVYYYKVTAKGFKDENSRRGVGAQLTVGYGIYNFSLTPGPNDPDKKPPQPSPVPTGKLFGRVWERTADGKLVALPAGVAATIKLRNNEATPPQVTVVTGQNDPDRRGGAYQVTLAAGSWQATVSAPGFTTLVDPQPIPIAADKTEKRDFELTRRQPQPPPAGQGIKGTISIRGPKRANDLISQVKANIASVAGQPKHAAAPNAKGQYSRELNSGMYRVTAELAGYVPASSPPRTVFKGKYTTVDLVLVALPEKTPPKEPEKTSPKDPEQTPPKEPEKTSPKEPPKEPDRLVQLTVEVRAREGAREGKPVAGARVQVHLGAQGTAAHRVVRENVFPGTNREGTANFELPRNNYWVSAGADGYRPAEAAADLTQGITLARVWLEPIRTPDLKDPDAGGPKPKQPEPEPKPKPQPTPTPQPVPMTDLWVVTLGPRGERISGATVTLGTGERGVRQGTSGRDGTLRFDRLPQNDSQYWVRAFTQSLRGQAEVPVRWWVRGEMVRVVIRGVGTGPAAPDPDQPKPPTPGPKPPVPGPKPPVPGPKPPTPQTASLSVLVLGARNDRVPNARVSIGLGDRTLHQGTSGSDGIVRFDGLPRNDSRYWVRAFTRDRRGEAEVPVQWWAQNQTARVVIRGVSTGPAAPDPDQPKPPVPGPKPPVPGPKPPIPGPKPPAPQTASLSVLVLNARGQSVSGANVSVGLGNRMLRQGTSGSDGVARFDGLPRDDSQYLVRAFTQSLRGQAEAPVRWWVRGETARVVIRGVSPGPDTPGPGRPGPNRPGPDVRPPVKPEKPNPPPARPQTGTLTVEVRGAHRNNPPVPGAQVSVSGGAVGQRVLQSLGGGQFRADLPAGQYVLRVSAAGYQAATQSVSIAPQTNNPVRVELRSAIQ